MFKKMIAAAVATVAMLAACTPNESSTAPAGEGPAIWKVSDEDTTIYMFGTVHVLPPGLEWRTPRLEAVMNEADVWYFEADPADDQDQSLQRKINAWGMMKPGESLFDLLSDEDRAALVAASEEVGIPGSRMAVFKPWFAAIILSYQHIVAQGQSPESGVESVLLPEGRQNGKQLRFLETAEDQMRVLAELPEDVQLQFLMNGVHQIDEIPDFIERMDKAWVTGDLETLEDIILSDQASSTPEVHEALLLKRNLAWAGALQTLAQEEEGTFFVAVGAAHLLGDDSVATLLKQYGLEEERIQ